VNSRNDYGYENLYFTINEDSTVNTVVGLFLKIIIIHRGQVKELNDDRKE